jgi:FlaA1/EpsC-like NDP-sugar epimerase
MLGRLSKRELLTVQKSGYPTFADEEQTPWKDRKFFVTGANGQIGRLLIKELCKEVGKERVFATDLNEM